MTDVLLIYLSTTYDIDNFRNFIHPTHNIPYLHSPHQHSSPSFLTLHVNKCGLKLSRTLKTQLRKKLESKTLHFFNTYQPDKALAQSLVPISRCMATSWPAATTQINHRVKVSPSISQNILYRVLFQLQHGFGSRNVQYCLLEALEAIHTDTRAGCADFYS